MSPGLQDAQERDEVRSDLNSSFYHLSGVDLTDQPCCGTACFVARSLNPTRWEAAQRASPRIYCLGKCYAAPSTAADDSRPRIEVASSVGVVLGRLAREPAPSLDAYVRAGGYTALEHALRMAPAEVVTEIETSGLRGRGGAGFPTGRKWRAVLTQPANPKYVVCNADEGDPGAYIDRFLLEDDPHCVIEAIAIAAIAVDASAGYVYVRKEYPRAAGAVRRALDEARAAAIIGRRILGSERSFDVTVVDGQGSYVCGEETALLNAVEHRRPEVRARPPFPSERGLFGQPTLVNNVETLASVPWILNHGGSAYAAMGTNTSRGTKVVSLNSLFARPGLYEVEFGTPVRDIVEQLGGGLRTGRLHGLLIGGPLAGILPPHLLDVPFAFDDLRRLGASVGHGGMVAFDDRTTIPELVHHVFRFGADESCGKCTPCRVGARRVEEISASALSGASPGVAAEAEWADTITALSSASLCGHGVGLAEFAESIATHYPAELQACLG